MRLRLDSSRVPALALRGFVATTAAGHRRVLRFAAREIARQGDLAGAPLPTALVEIFSRARMERRWQWSTTTTRMASVQGALRCLPLYAVEAAVVLAGVPVWDQAMRAARRNQVEEIGSHPAPATEEEVVTLLERQEVDPSLRLAVLLAWISAARVGCILQLRRRDITVTGEGCAITFRRGKGVLFRGPYTVHTRLPVGMQGWAMPILQALEPGDKVFPQVAGKQVCAALRRVSPRLEQRSLRRGALLALATAGVAEEDLLLFSGHTGVATLRRYLGWGKESAPMRTRMLLGARALLR
jgi:integrase